MTVSYKKIGEVTELVDGLPARLVLQRRVDNGGPEHHMVSWRTLYPSGLSNRRFYWQPGVGPWTIPVPVALRMMEAAKANGLLDSQYDRAYVRLRGGPSTFKVSAEIDRATRVRLLDEVTCDREEPDWGADPLLVVATQPAGGWRKVMLVDSRRQTATFCSCTTDPLYGPIKDMRNGSDWRLDNAMMDVDTATMREYLRRLREEQ